MSTPTIAVATYNCNFLNSVKNNFKTLADSEDISKIYVLDEYSDDGSYEEIMKIGGDKVTAVRNHNTCDRREKLEEICKDITEDWILFIRMYESVTEMDLKIIASVIRTSEEKDSIEVNWSRTFDYETKAVKTSKFYGFDDDFLPSLKSSLAQKVKHVILNKCEVIEDLDKDKKDFLSLFDTMKNKHKYRCSRFWYRAYLISKKREFLDKAEKLAEFEGCYDMNVHGDIYRRIARLSMSEGDNAKAMKYLNKILEAESTVFPRIDDLYMRFYILNTSPRESRSPQTWQNDLKVFIMLIFANIDAIKSECYDKEQFRYLDYNAAVNTWLPYMLSNLKEQYRDQGLVKHLEETISLM